MKHVCPLKKKKKKQSEIQHVLIVCLLILNFSVFQDTLHPRKLQQGLEPGAREPGEGAGESPLLHDDHGDSFN